MTGRVSSVGYGGMRRPRALAVGVTLCALVIVFAPVAGHATTQSELTAARDRLDTLVDRIADATRLVRSLEAEAGQLAQRMHALELRIEALEARLEITRAAVRAADARARELQAQLDARVRASYEVGAASTLEFLLGATSMSDLSDRAEYLSTVQEADADLLHAVEAARAEKARKAADLARTATDLDAQRVSLDGEREALEDKLATAQQTLERLNADRAEARTLVANLADQRQRELQAARLDDAADDGSSSNGGGGGPPSSGGGGPFFVCPVDQPRAYYSDFGVPRPGGRTHQGNDIFAPTGTPIRAPFPGNAVDASNELGGLSVSVYGSAGYVYNAHLSRIGTLGSVATGTIIGYVGNTGDARATSPHDHFEWHPGGGAAVDPYPFLHAVC